MNLVAKNSRKHWEIFFKILLISIGITVYFLDQTHFVAAYNNFKKTPISINSNKNIAHSYLNVPAQSNQNNMASTTQSTKNPNKITSISPTETTNKNIMTNLSTSVISNTSTRTEPKASFRVLEESDLEKNSSLQEQPKSPALPQTSTEKKASDTPKTKILQPSKTTNKTTNNK